MPSSDHDPDEPLADCPICGSNVLIRKPMTNLSFAVDHGKTVHTNKELANAAHVPIQLVTDMQFVERVKSASEKQRERMKAVADVLDVPLDYLLAFNPNASTISCGELPYNCTMVCLECASALAMNASSFLLLRRTPFSATGVFCS